MRTRVVIYVILVCLIYFPLAGQDFRQENAVESVESVDNPGRNLWWVTIGPIIPLSTGPNWYLSGSFSHARVPWLLTTLRIMRFDNDEDAGV